MTNTLQNWYNNGNISYSEKQRLNTMGVSDYDYHSLQDFRKMLECEDAARRLSYVPERVHQINFFSTWFNNNCATVIGGEHNDYCLKLFIHEPRQGGMVENVWKEWITGGTVSQEELRDRARRVENGLMYGKNPILQVHDDKIDAFAHAYRVIDLSELPMIKKRCLPATSYYELSNLNPDHYFKPFDIMKRPLQTVFGKQHSAVYLGNGQLAHVYDAGSSISGAISGFSVVSSARGSLAGSAVAHDQLFGTQAGHIGDWKEFLAGAGGEVERYHPVIPYKNQEQIKSHIAKAVSSKEYEAGQYSITGIFQGSRPNEGNCHHFANRCVLGLNFSEEGTHFKKKVPLGEEIGNTDRLFDNLTIRSSSELSSNQSKVNNAVQSWINNHQQGQQFTEAKIEVRPSPPCKVQ
jgi:hypothetical protein